MDSAGDSTFPFNFYTRSESTELQNLRRQVRESEELFRKLDLEEHSVFSANPSETLITKPIISKTLPERYEILDRLFSSLQTCIGLVGLEGSPSTFTNVSCMMEKIADIKFGYSHLAQLKFIFAEGIEIRNVVVFYDHPSCTKPDLLLTLNFAIISNVEKLDSEMKNSEMRRLFRYRLISYYESNPEGDEIPEETLPDPNRVNPNSVIQLVPASDSVFSLNSWFSNNQEEPFIGVGS